MEQSEIQLYEKIKQVIKDSELDLHLLGKSRIKDFSTVLYRLLNENGEKFDVVVGGGNSGLYTLKITEFAYEYLGLAKPIFVKIPVVRHKKKMSPEEPTAFFDNSVLIPSVKAQLPDVTDVKNILFVDDEIMSGTTARNCFELVQQAVYGDTTKLCQGTIVAEHHFFEWHHNTPNLSLRFFSNGKVIPGTNNLISYFLPEELFQKVQELFNFGEATKHNRAMSLVIGGALKADKVEVPFYDYSKEDVLVENILGYKELQAKLLEELRALVIEGIEEYKAGKIKFKF